MPLSKECRSQIFQLILPASDTRTGGGHWPPQYFADQLTLFEPGRADYPHLLLLAPTMFSPSGITACKRRRPQINLP